MTDLSYCIASVIADFHDLRTETDLLSCISVLYETLRMYPPVHSIPKSVAEDTTLTISNSAGQKTTLILPQGSSISIHTPGLHYNRASHHLPLILFLPWRLISLWNIQPDIGKTHTPSTPSGSSTPTGHERPSSPSVPARVPASADGSQRRNR